MSFIQNPSVIDRIEIVGKITRNPLEYDACIPNVSFAEFMLEKIQRFGENVALIDPETKDYHTYSKVHSKIHQLAIGFQVKFNLKSREKVAISLSAGTEYPIIALAINLCGATAILINPGQTVDELKNSFEITSPRLWVRTESITSKFEEIFPFSYQNDLATMTSYSHKQGNSITFNDLINLGSKHGAIFKPPNDLNPREDAAFILFSSGTTGLPKGVVMTHENYIALQRQTEEIKKIGLQLNNKNWTAPTKALKRVNEPCFLAFLPFYHTMGINAVFDQLAAGMKCVVLKRYTFPKLLKTIEEFKITKLTLVPPIVVRLAKEQVEKEYNLSSLEDIYSGGAPLSQETMAAFERKFGSIITKGYGMTEASRSHSTRWFPKRKDSIGVVNPFFECKVVDVNSNKTLRPFEEGEICVHGPMVMKGYIGNKEATTNTIDNEGWLHSGDMGYYDNDGFFFITDRMKELIKFNGIQISPVEIEQIILAHPDVMDAAVAPVPDESAGELPRAYIVKRPGSLVNEKDIASLVAEKLSGYKKLRGGVIFVKDIPKTSSGKILRRQLKAFSSKL